MYRQGDILLRKAAAVSGSISVGRSYILATGEATGHKHVLVADEDLMLLEQGDKRFLEVSSPAVLRHEEHAAIAVEPGTYEVVRQREYENADEYRTVSD